MILDFNKPSMSLNVLTLIFIQFGVMIGVCHGGDTGMKLMTRDLGDVKASCDTDSVPFVVSVNRDNDRDGNAKDGDRNRSPLPQHEDNLRHLNLPTMPGATQLVIDEPEDAATGNSVEGKRVRSWAVPATAGDFSTSPRFKYGSVHNPPIEIYLEGKQASGGAGDTVIKYRYYPGDPKKNNPVCFSQFTGAVVDVQAELRVETGGDYVNKKGHKRNGGGTQFSKTRKILINGDGKTKAQAKPALNPAVTWQDENGGTFGAANAMQTTYQAPSAGTTTRDSRQIRLQLVFDRLTIEAHRPFNVTRPDRARLVRSDSFPVTTGFIDANSGSFTLFGDKDIDYEIQDQFGDKIKSSAYGGRMVQIRENIGREMTSTIPDVQHWIDNDLSWAETWRDKPGGSFTDELNAFGISKEKIRVLNPGSRNSFQFHPDLQQGTNTQPTGVMMRANSHTWEVSVSGNGVEPITNNTFVVRVAQMQGNPVSSGGTGREISLRSEYTVTLPP